MYVGALVSDSTVWPQGKQHDMLPASQASSQVSSYLLAALAGLQSAGQRATHFAHLHTNNAKFWNNKCIWQAKLAVSASWQRRAGAYTMASKTTVATSWTPAVSGSSLVFISRTKWLQDFMRKIEKPETSALSKSGGGQPVVRRRVWPSLLKLQVLLSFHSSYSHRRCSRSIQSDQPFL